METSHTWLGRLTAAPDGADWRHLSDVYGQLLRGWAGRAGVPEGDRDDVVQDAFVVIVGKVGGFEWRGPGAFRGWLRVILANQLRKYFRDRPARPAFDPDQLAVEDSLLVKLWDRDHDEFVAARAMRAAEADFTPATWAAFHRIVIDGCKPAAVAAELGLSMNAVLIAKSRVLKRLREELQGLAE